jgi:hypothetical protein
MINKIGTQIPPQVRFKGQDNQTQQSSPPPVHKYVERNQLFNIATSGVMGTLLGVVNSRDELTRAIEAAGGETRATIKDALSSGNLGHTLGKVGKTILLLSGALYISDYAFQKVLKTNKAYEDYYNENRNS